MLGVGLGVEDAPAAVAAWQVLGDRCTSSTGVNNEPLPGLHQ